MPCPAVIHKEFGNSSRCCDPLRFGDETILFSAKSHYKLVVYGKALKTGKVRRPANILSSSDALSG